MDPSRIEAAITPQTSAIIATHVFGNPCDMDANCISSTHKDFVHATYGDLFLIASGIKILFL